MSEFTVIIQYFFVALAILYAITLHEIAHGWVAKQSGDTTAADLGRLSLNPIKHIDPIGTVVVPITLLITFGAPFGWAKPVPVNWQRLKHPKRDMALVAIAGPLANLMMLIFWAIILTTADKLSGEWWNVSQMIIYIANIGILINAVIMVLNMLPIPPLDGSRIVSSLIPNQWSKQYSKIEPYGIGVVILLMVTGVLGDILMPTVKVVSDVVISIIAKF